VDRGALQRRGPFPNGRRVRSVRLGPEQPHSPVGEGPGLVEHDRVDVGRLLEDGVGDDHDPAPGRVADPGRDR